MKLGNIFQTIVHFVKRVKAIQDRLYFGGLVALLTLLSIYVWFSGEKLTAGISDISYHLTTATSFARAGGVVGWDFWESLPLGRAHTYPPLFHLIFANLIKMAVPPWVSVRLMFEFTVVGGMAIYTLGIKKLLNIKVAFWAVFLLAFSTLFIKYIATLMPSSLALFLTPLLFYFLREKKFISYSIILVFIFYLHLFFTYPILLGLLSYILIFKRELFVQALKATLVAFLFYLPWLIHVVMGFDYIKYFSGAYSFNPTQSFVSVNILIYLAAIATIIMVFFKKDSERNKIAPMCCLAFSLILVAFFAAGRTLGAHALIPLAALAGYSITYFWERGVIFKVLIAGVVVIYSMQQFYLSNGAQHYALIEMKSIFYGFGAEHRDEGISFRTYQSLFDIVKENSKPDESVAFATKYFDPRLRKLSKTDQFAVANFIAGSSSRPSLNLCSPEIFYRKPPDLSQARVLALNSTLESLSPEYFTDFSYPKNQATAEMTDRIKKNFVDVVAYPALDSQRFYVYKNNTGEVMKESKPKFVFPLFLADIIVGILILEVILDNRSSKGKCKG